MNLKKELRNSYGYDLIDSPIRNHKPLQLWQKKGGDPVKLIYEHISHALISDQHIRVIEDVALSVNYSHKLEYKFNIGITVLDHLLTSLGLGKLTLSTKFDKGRNVEISYDQSKSFIVPAGELSNFLENADFQHPNKELLRNANRNNLLIITGVLMAKNIKALIHTKSSINSDIEIELNEIAEGQVLFSKIAETKLEMISENNALFPIAVQAHKIDWDHGDYQEMKLITDQRNLF